MYFQIFLRVFLLSFLFTTLLFAYEKIISQPDILLEEEHIEPSLLPLKEPIKQDQNFKGDISKGVTQEQATILGDLPQTLEETSSLLISQNENKQIEFLYIPENFRGDIIEYTKLSRSFLDSRTVAEKIEKLNIEFYKILGDIRGKMKQKTVKIWGVSDMNQTEFLSVFVHEFAHYLDLYFFSDTVFGDISQKFYSISWQSTKIIKKGQIPSNFVSGYASTNKYEDFAESFTYYVFHNRDFFIKAQKNSLLQEKYDFFRNELFLSGEFQGTDFSNNGVIKEYYWDITKIDFESKNFLQYLENEI